VLHPHLISIPIHHPAVWDSSAVELNSTQLNSTQLNASLVQQCAEVFHRYHSYDLLLIFFLCIRPLASRVAKQTALKLFLIIV